MPEFDKWTVKALKEYCKEQNIKIPSNSKKADIVNIVENTTPIVKNEYKTDYEILKEQKQDIIKKAISVCKKEGEEKILNYFKRRSENRRAKQVFEIYQLNLDDPDFKEIRFCLKYYQETQKYDKIEKLLINQMITQPKYIDPTYENPRRNEFKQIEVESATYDVPISKTSKAKSLNSSINIDR